MSSRYRDDVLVRETNELETPTPRSRRPLVVVAVLAVLAVAALAVVYLTFFNEDSPPPLALSDQPATTTAATSPATTAVAGAPAATTAPATNDIVGTWRVAAGSTAG